MPTAFSAARPTTYGGAFASDRLPSGTIWSDLPSMHQPGKLRGFFNDFVCSDPTVATTVSWEGIYNFLDTSDTITNLVTSPYGILDLASAATDNNSPCIQMPFGAGFIVFNTRANGGSRIWFEARVAVGSVTDCGYFIGLMEEASAADNWMTDDDAVMADKDHVGFHSLTATPTELDVVHTLSGQVDIEVAGAAHTLTASLSTFIKLGMKFDPQWGSEGEIRFYINGAELGAGSRVTNIDQAAFPDTEEMSPLIGLKNGTAAARHMYIDWVGCFQEEL